MVSWITFFGSWKFILLTPKHEQETSSLVWFQRLPLKSQGATCYQHWRKCSTTWGSKETHISKMWSLSNSKNNNNLFEWMFRGNSPYVWLKIPPMFDWMFRGICQQTYLNYVLSIFRLAFFFGVGKSWKPIHPSENMGPLKVAVFKKTKTLANHPPCCTEKFRCFRCLEVSIYEETLAKYQVDK